MSARTTDLLEGETILNGQSTRDKMLKYVTYLPLFIISQIICIAIGFVYIRYTTPKYNISTLILVKTTLPTSSTATNISPDLVTTALSGGKEVLLDNEVRLIRSVELMKRVVQKNHFNISYFEVNKFNNSELYVDKPFQLIQQDSGESTPFTIRIKNCNDQGAEINYGNDENLQTVNYKWGEILKMNGKPFVLIPLDRGHIPTGSYVVTWNTVETTANQILENLTVDILDKKTTILQVELIYENIRRGEDILNSLWKEYTLQDIEEKKVLAQNTIRFIDDRLSAISRDLNGVETSLEDFQGNNRLINVETQSNQSLHNSSDISKDITTYHIQQGVVTILQNYFNNPEAQNSPVPSSLGITDPTLASLISKYNDLQLKKQREVPLLSSNSLILQDLNNQLNGLKSSILENLQNIKKNLQLQEANLQQKDQQYNQFLSALPHKERVMQGIKRKQTITEGLYLYLLQKREEAVISASNSNVSAYKQIDSAKGLPIPIAPKPRLVKLLSIILGLLLPLIWIRIRENLYDKITGESEITSKLHLPVLGKLSHIPKKKSKEILLINESPWAEELRKIRTNIVLWEGINKKQVILITSALAGEGKSLIAQNLASILALPSKKVACLDFNFLNANSLGGNNTKGLTDYLNGDIRSISEIPFVENETSTVHLFSPGRIRTNPGDLLLNDNLSGLINLFKVSYDYVIINSSPTILASDAFLLGKESDITLFVIRQNFTPKKQIDFLEDIALSSKLNNIGIIINDASSSIK